MVLITKVDLLPHLPVDLAAIRGNIHSINPNATVIEVSALTGEGIDTWHQWVQQALQSLPADRPGSGHGLSCPINPPTFRPCRDQTTTQSPHRCFRPCGGGRLRQIPNPTAVGGTPIVLGYSNYGPVGGPGPSPSRKSCSRRTA